MKLTLGNGGLGLKLFVILIAFALIPLICLGILSFKEMNQASEDVSIYISSLSTTLNRSALAVEPNEADQVQLATAKALQYDDFFKRIKSENELISRYVSQNSENGSCDTPPGIWVAPTGSNQTDSIRRSAVIRSLCAPAKLMQSLFWAEPSLSLSYIGTEDGVLVTWPYSNETISNVAPFGYKDKPYYASAKAQNKTIWTGPYLNGEGQPMIIVTTPIYRDGKFLGIAGMDSSLEWIYRDVSSNAGRGYPFIVDDNGKIIIKPQSKPNGILKGLFQSDNLTDAESPDAERLLEKMFRGSSGSEVIGLGTADGYVAYSSIPTVGWRLAVAYPAEEMSLPASFIDSGIKNVANGATTGLNNALANTRIYTFMILGLTAAIAMVVGFLISRRINRQINVLIEATEKVSKGDFDFSLKPFGELWSLDEAFNKMVKNLIAYSVKLTEDSEERGGSGRETDFLSEIKRNLTPGGIPAKEGYQIRQFYQPTRTNRFDFLDIIEAGEDIAITMAGVGGDGIQAAMLAIMSRTLIRASPDLHDPIRAIAELNSQINEHARGMNLSCFYALLDPLNHFLEYVNAGFNPPFIVDSSGIVDTLGGNGIALGMLDKIDLQKERIPIQKGDVIVIYSNGLIESENDNKEQFGVERLIGLIISNRSKSAEDILDALESNFREFTKSSKSLADITLAIIKRN